MINKVPQFGETIADEYWLERIGAPYRHGNPLLYRNAVDDTELSTHGQSLAIPSEVSRAADALIENGSRVIFSDERFSAPVRKLVAYGISPEVEREIQAALSRLDSHVDRFAVCQYLELIGAVAEDQLPVYSLVLIPILTLFPVVHARLDNDVLHIRRSHPEWDREIQFRFNSAMGCNVLDEAVTPQALYGQDFHKFAEFQNVTRVWEKQPRLAIHNLDIANLATVRHAVHCDSN